MADDWNDFNRKLIAEFRENGGKVGGQFEGAPLAVFTMTGAKSGQPREIPLVYTTDGDRLVIIASKGGAPTNPDWYYNLAANPSVKVELPGETYQAQAAEVTGEERDRLYDQQAALMPNFAEYQAGTDRKIPVFVIERRLVRSASNVRTPVGEPF